MSQEPVLFKRSVYENILYGLLDDKKEEVRAAAQATSIEKLFNQQEMGTKEDPRLFEFPFLICYQEQMSPHLILIF